MLLAIDVGNTNIVFSIFDDGGNIAGQWRLLTIPEIASDELVDWFDRELASAKIEKNKKNIYSRGNLGIYT